MFPVRRETSEVFARSAQKPRVGTRMPQSPENSRVSPGLQSRPNSGGL